MTAVLEGFDNFRFKTDKDLVSLTSVSLCMVSNYFTVLLFLF